MPFAIYTDLSGVAEIADGLYDTELEAIQSLILHLESNRTDITTKIAAAKRRRRALNRKNT